VQRSVPIVALLSKEFKFATEAPDVAVPKFLPQFLKGLDLPAEADNLLLEAIGRGISDRMRFEEGGDSRTEQRIAKLVTQARKADCVL
jgi:hypothetical protein